MVALLGLLLVRVLLPTSHEVTRLCSYRKTAPPSGPSSPLTVSASFAGSSVQLPYSACKVWEKERGEVLYLALEDNERRLHKRLGKLLNGYTPPSSLHIALDWTRLDEGGVEALDRFLREHPDTRLVVVDTLKKIRPRASGNRSLYDVDYEALEPLLPLAAEHRVAILVVHHSHKMEADDPLNTISGSTGLSGGVDGAFVLKRDRSIADASLYVTGREIEEE